jgi:parallel beta-helix repeat protein
MSRTALGIVLAILLVSIPALSSSVPTARAITTIYIQADGTISPTSAPIQRNGDVYTLTGNINSDADGIVIERNNTVLDGAGYTLQGTNTGSSTGIYASGISGVTIRNINVKAFESGILLDAYSTFNQIIKNKVEDNDYGINCWAYSDSNNITGNNITANHFAGIWIIGSSDINVSENNIMGNSQYGMSLESSSNSSVFHNSFINNANQIDIYDSTSFWDNGYPSGGNYWSDYNGVDTKCGPNQDHPGADGIGDTPYALDSNNIDRYPLMSPWPPEHDVAIINVSPLKTVVGLGYSVNVSVTAINQGQHPEVCNVTWYANTTILASQNVTLSAGDSATVKLTWGTTGSALGNYTIYAYAWPVPGENNTANNNCTCNVAVHVGVPGDVSSSTPGVYDKVDNMFDVAYMISLFNTRPSSPNWNPNADVNNDGVCNMMDIAIPIHYFNNHE